MKIRFLAVTVLVVAGILSLVAGCSGTGNLTVSVVDSSGNPLWGAKVVSQDQPAGQLKITGITSQEAGGVVFNGIKTGDYSLQVSCADFAPGSVDVRVASGSRSITVTLYYASPPPAT